MISRRILAAVALLCAPVIPAQAQKTRAQLNSEIGTSFPDNNFPLLLRNVTNDIVNSIMPTAPVTNGNVACFNGTTGLLQDCATPVLPGSLTLNPTAGTLNAGFTVNQTGPASGSVVGPWSGNLINTTFSSTVTGSTNPWFDFGVWQTEVSAFRSNLTVGGPNLNGESFNAGFFHTRLTSPANPAGDGDFIGAAGVVYANVASVNSALHGLVGATVVDAGSNIRAMNGLFSEVDIINGGLVQERRGINIVSQAPGIATGAIDTAIQVASQFTSGAFKKFAVFNTFGGTIQPIQATGDMFWSDGAFTLANMFNLPNLTLTGNIFNLPHFTLSGAGVLNAGGGAADINAGSFVNASISSGGVAALISQVNGTSGFDGFHTNNSTLGTSLFAVVFEPSDTSTGFGQTRANWAELLAAGPNNDGLLIGTAGNKPVIFGTNNTGKMQLLNGLAVGSTTDPGAGFISASNGMIAGGGSSDINTGSFVNASISSGGVAALISQVNGTSGFDGFHTNNSTIGTSLFAVVFEPSDTSTGFGQTRANWAELLAAGPNNNGLLIGTVASKPVIFGTNNTESMRLLTGLSVGTTSDPGAGLIYQNSASFLMRTKTSWNTGAAAATGTLTNAPAAGNPTKWIPVDDNGTTRYIPAW
jgi:hypothetical protein